MSNVTHELRKTRQKDIEAKVSVHDPMPKFKKEKPGIENGNSNFIPKPEDLPFNKTNANLKNLINACYHSKLYEEPGVKKEESVEIKPKKGSFNPFKKKFTAIME